MNWFMPTAPFAITIDFGGAAAIAVVAWLVIGAPSWLALRDLVGLGSARRERPQLRVVEGGREPRRRAA